MTRNYNVTGEARKQMVQIISREVGVDPIYTRMPECAYVIGGIKVSKTGEMIWDNATGEETIRKIETVLKAAGFTAEEPEETEEPAEPAATEEANGEDTNETEEPDGLSFSFPRADFTELALINLKNLVASKQTLIRKGLQADRLNIEIDDEKVTFPWWDRIPTPEQTRAYGKFLAALVKMAKEARRASKTEHATESEKYTFRTFLLRLGFGGAEHKEARAILMEHLTGHAAFKNQADADAFYEKQKEKKAAAKAAGAGEADGTENTAAEEEGAGDEISE